MNIHLNENMVAYGSYYITKTAKGWDVTKSGKDKSVLFNGTYEECITHCKLLKGETR